MKRVIVVVVPTFVFLLAFLKLIPLNGGIILGEPDEVVHADVVTSLINTRMPAYGGSGFYFDLPAYFTVAATFSQIIIHNPLVSLRAVSFLATLLTSLIVYYYLLKKEDRRVALVGALLYFLIPLSIFYSRVGVIEPFLVLGMTGSLCFFDLGRDKKNIWYSVLSGLFLGLSFLTKYTILPIFAVMALYLIFDFVRSNRYFLRDKYLHISLYSFVPLVLGLLIFLPVLIYFYKQDPWTVKWQTYQILGLFGGVKQELRPGRILEFPWWFSWPIVALAVVGIGKSFAEYKKYLSLILGTLVMLFVVLSRLPFYPRYALVLVPFLCMLSALGLSFVTSSRLRAFLFLFLIVMNILPLSEAFRSADQRIIENSVAAAKAGGSNPSWAFSNYWPNYFGKLLPVNNYAWLTYDGPDLRAYAPGENRDALSILKTDGGAVFLENLYADLTLTQQPGRLRAIDEVKKTYSPTFTVRSQSPNFPFSRKPGDSIDVYIFKKL